MSDIAPEDVRIHGFVHELPSPSASAMSVEDAPPTWRPINVHELLFPPAAPGPADDTDTGAST